MARGFGKAPKGAKPSHFNFASKWGKVPKAPGPPRAKVAHVKASSAPKRISKRGK